jgi:phosphate acyltransferase
LGMAEALVISIDAMGGDHAPEIVVDGVEALAARRPDVRFLLHGPADRLATLLASRPRAQAVCQIRPAETVVAMDAKPSQALRQGRKSSMWNAIGSVAEGEAAAAVSAGNTGALMAMAKLRLRTVANVHRPALVANWPTTKDYAAVLDVGANIEADAEQLVEFAIMGEAFHRAVHGKARPRVALLNIGSEELKGHDEIRGAAELIRNAGVDIDFAGFIEGDAIGKGEIDVIVTDGFTGNIALKTAEGTAKQVAGYLRATLKAGLLSRLGALLLAPALLKLRAKMDPGRANGAVFLGLNGLVVKSHGGTDAAGFAAALDVAVRMAASHFQAEVAANLARFAAAAVAPAPAGDIAAESRAP